MRSAWLKAPLLLASIGLAVAAGINAEANRWRMADPDLTLRLRPDDAVALTLREDRRQALTALTPARASILAETARTALRSDPLTAPALRQIAVAESLAGRTVVSDRLLALARMVTRRDLGTSWLLIEEGLASGNVQAILQHFDDALTTNLVAPDLMYPALAAALFDPGLRAGLVPHIRGISPWIPNFLRYVITSGGNDANVADLVIRAGGLPPSPLYVGVDGRILSALSEQGRFDLAEAYIGKMPGQRAGVMSDVRLTPATMDSSLGPFAWSLFDLEGLGARQDTDGNMIVRVGRDQGGRVAVRRLMLQPGRYRIGQLLTVPTGAAPAALRWDMTCLPSLPGAALWSLETPTRLGERVTSDIVVPPNCPAQQLALTASNDGEEDAEIIVGLALTRL